MREKNTWDGERLMTFVFNEATVEHLHRYAVAMELAPGKTVLDIACGEGYGAALLAGKATHVTGVDTDAETIHNAKDKYKAPNLEFLNGAIENIPAQAEQFDFVVCFETLEHITDHDTALQEIKRVLKKGGQLIISTPDKANYTDKPGIKNPFHTRELYKDEFLALLKKHFRCIDCYGQQISHASILSSPHGGTQYYQGNYAAIYPGPATEFLYHLAIASDEPVPALPSSIFNGNSLMQKGLEWREKMVMNTITYKTGHFLLYPFKAIRSLFRK